MKGLTFASYFKWDTENYIYDIVVKDENGHVLNVTNYYPEILYGGLEVEVELVIVTHETVLLLEFHDPPEDFMELEKMVAAPRRIGVYRGREGRLYGITGFTIGVTSENYTHIKRTDTFTLMGGNEIIVQVTAKVRKNKPKGGEPIG